MYPLVMINIAIENGHVNSEFSHEKMVDLSIVFCKRLPEGTRFSPWFMWSPTSDNRHHLSRLLGVRFHGNLGKAPSENCRNNYLSDHSTESGCMVNLGWIGEPSVLTHYMPKFLSTSHHHVSPCVGDIQYLGSSSTCLYSSGGGSWSWWLCGYDGGGCVVVIVGGCKVVIMVAVILMLVAVIVVVVWTFAYW